MIAVAMMIQNTVGTPVTHPLTAAPSEEEDREGGREGSYFHIPEIVKNSRGQRWHGAMCFNPLDPHIQQSL